MATQKWIDAWQSFSQSSAGPALEAKLDDFEELIEAETDDSLKGFARETLFKLRRDVKKFKLKAAIPFFFLKGAEALTLSSRIGENEREFRDRSNRLASAKRTIAATETLLTTAVMTSPDILPSAEMLMARNPTFAERSLEIVNAALAFEVILDSNDRGTLTAFWQHTFDQYIVPQSQQTESLPPPLDGSVAYEIGRPLGTGSYAEVYRAIVATTPPAVIAVKRVTSKGEDAEEVYNRECRILKEVGKHPNVVQYLGATKWNPNTLFNDIFLEYAGGATIEKILACNGRFPESWCKGVMRQVLKGLCHLHSLEIVHRDIKGDNIIITAFGVVKLSDLGISKFVEDIPALGAPSTDTGTDGYVAPEILQRNGGYTPLADIWSTGCLLLEMFHGKWPSAEYTNHVWEGENDGQVKDVNKIISPRAAVSEQVRSLLTRHILVGAEYRLSAEKLLSVVWLQ